MKLKKMNLSGNETQGVNYLSNKNLINLDKNALKSIRGGDSDIKDLIIIESEILQDKLNERGTVITINRDGTITRTIKP